jgi:hypothetical protein
VLLRCCVIHVVFVCGHVLSFFSEGGTHPFMCSVEEEMEAGSSSETSMNLYQSVRRQMPVFFMDRFLRYYVTLRRYRFLFVSEHVYKNCYRIGRQTSHRSLG